MENSDGGNCATAPKWDRRHWLRFRQVRGDMIETYKILTGKYDVDVTPKVLSVYDLTTRGNMFKLNKVRAKYDFRKFYFTNRFLWLMLGTISQTMLYYLKQLTLLNHDLINFGKDMIYDFQAELHGTGSRSLHHN